ncbi:MAG: hypothetical protein HDR29_01920 [Lachnospiraceae bacterium]|nr:hypothetical protein [Lachnospiraceae bacterium]
MNKQDREALNELRKYEMEVIEKNMLERATNQNKDYNDFEYSELMYILNCLKAKHDLFVKVTSNIELLIGILLCTTVALYTSLPMLMSCVVNVIIMLILYSVWRYACRCSFERITNFLSGKCSLHRFENNAAVDIDGFRSFTIIIPNNK